jgi:hypothetical protein
MADYYSILKKTVSGLPANTAENRKLVYGKARSAIDRQLRGITPPPSDEAISRQMSALEAAIEQIEAENQAVRHAVPPPPATAAAMSTPAAPASVAARPVIPAPPPERPAAPPPIQTAAPRPEMRTARADPVFDPVARPAAEPPRKPAPPPAGPRVAEPPPYDTSLDAVRDIERPVRVRQAAAPRPADTSRRSSTVTMVILLLVVLGLFAGGGYALWRNKEPLLAALGLGGNGQQATAPAEEAQAPQPSIDEPEGTPKEEARLGGQDQPPSGTPAEPPATDTAEDETPPPATEPEAEPATEPAGEMAAEPATEPSAEPAPPPAEEEAAGEPAQVQPVEPVAPQPEQQAQVPVTAPQEPAQNGIATASTGIAQKGYLYEEGVSGSGATRDNAAVIWSMEQQPPADGMPPEPVIRGRVEVPGRGLMLDVIIKRNVDEALSASHIIELVFQAPPDFTGGNIDNVARFVMKANEQARGEGLVAVPVKIDTGYFLIALNNLEQAAATNKRLLLDSSWIDIPLGYTTGRRALVTLEKGAIGDKVFRDAFADWDKR